MTMTALRIAGWTTLLIALGHALAVLRMRDAAHWTGVGPEFDRLGERFFLLPHLMTLGAAAVFAAFGVYALSGAGDIRPLPWLRSALAAIAALFLVRALGGLGFGGLLEDEGVKQQAFSCASLALGLLYLAGAWGLRP